MSLRLDVYLHLVDIQADHRLDQLVTIVKQIQTRQEAMMATLDETLALVTAETTQLDSVIALIDGLKAQLDEVLAGTTLPPAVQAKVDAIFSAAGANAAKIVDALDTNVPPPPPEGFAKKR